MAAPDVDETMHAGETPDAYVERIGALKAAALAVQPGDIALLVADTTVVVDDHILGKPETADAAQRMLEELSGRTHVVATRFLLRRLSDGRTHAETVRTAVVFRALGRAELEAYARSGEGADKAGGYAIQGGAAAFVSEIRGSYTNVVGLPLAQVAEALDRLGLR